MATEQKIPEIIRSSMENIRSMVDANTIVGDPVTATGGTVIIPISKIAVGIASGGVDYASKNDVNVKPQNFGGGGHPRAAGCTVDLPAEEACKALMAAAAEELAKW